MPADPPFSTTEDGSGTLSRYIGKQDGLKLSGRSLLCAQVQARSARLELPALQPPLRQTGGVTCISVALETHFLKQR